MPGSQRGKGSNAGGQAGSGPLSPCEDALSWSGRGRKEGCALRFCRSVIRSSNQSTAPWYLKDKVLPHPGCCELSASCTQPTGPAVCCGWVAAACSESHRINCIVRPHLPLEVKGFSRLRSLHQPDSAVLLFSRWEADSSTSAPPSFQNLLWDRHSVQVVQDTL